MAFELPPLPFVNSKLTTGQLLTLAAPIIATIPYFFFSFPSPKTKVKVHPSLGTLPGPETALLKRIKELYPEDIYPEGGYAYLPWGRLRYYMIGSEYSPKVVLISGLSLPTPIWSTVIDILKTHFRVLVYDHYGRGYSDAPEVTYDNLFYCTELALLMQYIKWDKAHIIGLSMGGGIAASFVTNFPHLVDRKLGLIAPAGLLSNNHFPSYAKVLCTPLGQYVASSSVVQTVLKRMYKVPDASQGHAVLELQGLQRLVLPYHLGALVSSIRDGPLRGLEEVYSKAGSSNVDVIAIWGTADEVVPYSIATKLLSRIPKAKLVTIPDGQHDITASHGETVGQALKEFLRG
ncbi:hypothetical protein FRB99_003372 [Tulasnella sp. 403]|nr:hypothetical protein FRB99_003372 [Tulasnella sp. 403]